MEEQSGMTPWEYLRFVANVMEKANDENSNDEVVRLLRLCATACTETAGRVNRSDSGK